ncbi:MAG TPA: carboxypeptidase-like regulatory domain-containing protein [Bacteroidales bacterium]|nr:carboxypeptidase-like regulatory domain-containing protein [Bacteroidales bacterium]
MNKRLYIFIFVCIAAISNAQKPIMVTGNIFDSETGEPVSEVHIYIKDGKTGTTSDSKGTFSITLNNLNDTLFFTHVRYNDYMLVVYSSDFQAQILLEPRINMLPDAIVKPVVNISKGMLLDVTDYYFHGDSIIYSGFCYRYNKHSNPWIIMISPKGDTIFTYCVGKEGHFYEDCFGNLHYLTDDTAYQMVLSNDSVYLDFPTNIDEFLEVMETCKFTIGTKALLSQYTNKNQMLIYYYTDIITYETEVFKIITDEIKLNMLAGQNLFFAMGCPPNEHDLRFEEMMYNPVFAPIIKTKDTISIINYTDSKVEWYDTLFNYLGEEIIYFQNSKFCQDEILVDKVSGRVFAVYFRNGKTSVKEIFIHSGTTGKEISIPDFFWIENIKIHDNQLFFLYRKQQTGDLRALYRMALE